MTDANGACAPTPEQPNAPREPEEGRILPPYGGIETCRNSTCGESLNEEQGAYLHSNRETGKLIVFCGGCSRQAQMFDALRFPLVAL